MIRDRAKNLKQGLKDRGKAKVGIMIHRKIGDLFEFDDKAVELSEGVIQEYKDGDKESAVHKSKLLEHYIKARMNQEGRYKQKAQELSGELEDHKDKIEKAKKKLDSGRFQDLLDGAVDPDAISSDVDEELLEDIKQEAQEG